ncbi:MFS transporter [Erwiniaceae bacterium L1_54_6]|uniref:MFS transporter n=1 Tax=Pantoea cypripedii TaxID=55209 RepID=A0A6B9GBT8_PANCY|nr:MFS transporter [Pantoea cypripedii]MDF7661952.1 MFS transporter [Erwiniaceae bacterium L1_54_6]QGY32790.1 MFS transporter [Pantoea cypripedii]
MTQLTLTNEIEQTESPGSAVHTIRSASDVSQLVNNSTQARSNARIIVAIALGGIFLDAYDLGALAFGVKDITREFGLGPKGIGLVVSAITMGAIVGALIGGYLTDKIGRYRVFMADMFFFVFAAILGALAPNAEVLGISRFIMGLGIGIDLPVAMAFLAEFSRLKGRGNKAASIAMWCPTWYAAISVSYLLVLAFFYWLPESQTASLWRYIVGFGAVPALVILTIRKRYMTESPVWAANQGDLEQAAQILRVSYNIPAVAAPQAEAAGSSTAIRHKASWKNYGLLLRGHYLRRTILTSVMSFVSPFAYGAIAFGLPIIVSTLFQQSMLTTILVSLALNLFFAFTGGLAAVRLVPRFGARAMSIAGYACQLVALLGLALAGRPDDELKAALCCAYLALFLLGQGFGPGAQTMVYASLSYPASIRGVGVGLNQTITRFATTIALFLFPLLTASLDTGLFWVIALSPVLGLLALFAIRWEPAGYDIDAEDYADVVQR